MGPIKPDEAKIFIIGENGDKIPIVASDFKIDIFEPPKSEKITPDHDLTCGFSVKLKCKHNLKVRYSCSNSTHHEHKYFFVALLCGWLQKHFSFYRKVCTKTGKHGGFIIPKKFRKEVFDFLGIGNKK